MQKIAVRFFCLVISLILLTACEDVAVLTTPKKDPVYSDSEIYNEAEKSFWTTLHQGNYENIPNVVRLLTAAYLQNPNDPKLAAHLGFAHIWKIAERQRENTIEPTIVNEAILSRKYFSDAVELDPDDARYLGFLACARLMEGSIFNDKREQTRGYFTMKKAIHLWPQFNYFTGGYMMSSLPVDSKEFKEGLEWEWRNMDVCAREPVDRNNPDVRPYMKYETQQGPYRACWNSWIAPYNFEGFFLNMGDMLVKAGDTKTALVIYNNAKLASNYTSWPYRSVLEDRIKNIATNTEPFNIIIPYNVPKKYPANTIMFNSRFSCMACHQQAR